MEVPKVDYQEMMHGKVDHLPDYNIIPDEFKKPITDDRLVNRWVKFVKIWSFDGLEHEHANKLEAKEGVDKVQALRAIKAIYLQKIMTIIIRWQEQLIL